MRPALVAEALRARIDSGELEAGAKLPSTRHLAAEFEVNERTIYDAVALLRTTGHVRSQQGKGVFVRDYRPLEWHAHKFERGDRRDDRATNTDDWKAGVIEQGMTPSQDTPQVSVEVADARVAEWLQLGPGEKVVARRRLRRADERPYQLADSFFPEDIGRAVPADWDDEVSPLMAERDVTLPGGILASVGHPQRRVRDEISPRTPSTDEAERLEIAAGAPVCEHVRIGYGADGRPVRVMITIAPGDRNRIVYEMEL